MKKTIQASLKVTVNAYDKLLTGKATVRLTLLQADGERKPKSITLQYNKATGLYQAANLQTGTYRVEASADRYESQERTLNLNSGTHEEKFILGKKGMPAYYRGKVKVPFQIDDGLIAVTLAGKDPKQNEKPVLESARKLGLSRTETAGPIRADGVMVFSLPKKSTARTESAKEEIIRQLESTAGVRFAGPVIAFDKKTVSYLTRQIIVKFRSEIAKDRVPEIAKEYGCEVTRSISYLGNGWVFQTLRPASFKVLDICEKLVQSKLVEYAEPNMAFTVVDDFTPNDFLYPQQGHHAIIGSEAAWDITTGNESIIISVVDSGFDLTHPDFQNVMGAPWNKVYSPFDFIGMDADPLGADHGVESSGIATANGNNTEGISGLAPDCVLMPVRRPSGGTDLNYSDMYIWVGGFNPGSTTPGFPAAINPGADIITNSFGIYQAAISGIMSDTFDYLTSYGRNGKGCVVLYSVGNDNVDFNNGMGGDGRQWAAYPRTISVAASTISPPDPAEIKATTSNFGLNLDLCAPAGNSSGTQTRSISSFNVGGGTLAGTGGGVSLDYGSFGQTSCACPQVAGTVALMLSINPELSWIEVRQILRDTAVKIDFANVDPTGQWFDLDGDGNIEYSRWYGYGRLDAEAAVNAAGVFVANSDVLVRDNLADAGTVPSAGAWWASPDLWCRLLDPAIDGVAALPATYASAPPHETPDRSHDNWIYVRYKNTGIAPANNFYVRVYLSHFAGLEFVFPDDYIPTNNPGDPIPNPMTPGTYLIGETLISALAPGAEQIINMIWEKENIPPEIVSVNGMDVHWHPCLLVQITPFDGPAATGTHVWQNNNLAQRNISIIGVGDDDDDFSFAVVMGNKNNSNQFVDIEIDRGKLPSNVRLFMQVADRRAMEWIKRNPAQALTADQEHCELIILDDTDAIMACTEGKKTKKIPMHLAKNSKVKLSHCSGTDQAYGSYKFGKYKGKEVIFLDASEKVRVPVNRGSSKYMTLIIGGIVGTRKSKATYDIVVNQYDNKSMRSGSYGVQLEL